jgi:hypothetical protein
MGDDTNSRSPAVLLRIPRAHLLASVWFGLAYLVLFHVMAGHIAWQNFRVTSLLHASLSVSSGQTLAALFVLFLCASEWLGRKRSKAEGESYLVAACAVAAISLGLVWVYGAWLTTSTHELWPILAIYAAGAFWIAWRSSPRPLHSLSDCLDMWRGSHNQSSERALSQAA